ncbi:MAG: ATP-binding cassette domain-containing protein [Alphaproteobacteria bacterium]|jgi:ABC-2 type transport system ATP-binding protein|nr:ATP-binding cassette domain-containing protein [Alphaproteobacteria bacterium]MDP6814968.1 ATP-binding cassette domain-containing protein [Alphaproteobacteria bacterium]
MIEVEGLTKRYGSHLAIDDISFSVAKGEILGFLGPNGAGKTTTMRILTCFFPATGGSARVAGYDCFEDSMEVRRRIGYLPENVPLYVDMKVDEYLSFVAGVKGVDAGATADRVARTMHECGLEDVSGRIIGQLSKGYRQRVGLAQALVADPEILILDEPTIGLDPNQIRDIRKLIGELAGARTVILCSHILPEISMVCGRVVIINKGRLVAIDTPENLARQLHHAATIFVRVAGPAEDVVAALGGIPGVREVEVEATHGDGANGYVVAVDEGADVRRAIPPVIVEHGWDLEEIRAREASLEDVFVELVTSEVAA